MIVKAKIETDNEWLLLENLPDQYSPGHYLSEKQVTIKNLSVGMNNYQISTNGLFILHSEMKFDQPARIVTEVEGEAIACQFIFSNDHSSKKMLKPRQGRSRHNIRYIPSSKESYEVKPGIDYVYFLVVLSKDYYLHLVDFHSPLHEKFVMEMEQGIYTSFAEKDLFVTPEMRRSIDDILSCKQDGELKRMYTDARILELIMYQLEQFSSFPDEDKYTFKSEDLLKLEEAREILEQQFIQPPTQKQLSKIIFLNEFKLRSGFKKYYGTTIYDYITGLRMKQARKLIVEEKRNMYEVGVLVGFKHQGSFTHAFKKYYGILPSEVRN
ncbi:helix-turn-helix transcriptional regulator [Pedobacter sp. ISL-68]|uniref:helix-turn-helix transcriptional regulator n=1 Tax=unclassified Pedobacter TaxID=2628915 RepID=UPI001BEBE782|nr:MULTISPECIES: AraC family transcriptional regulator [unclassified Pedobacter]MBT2560145.1 helix-turn-helix transcriptional regulator [Pedobacter sp. ISL-64]MBT2589124.1 helix-turn-helix transcriptional regulator [Pedobacter sp. ISL-68]